MAANEASTNIVTVTIDGPSSCGKGTLARRIAAHLGVGHLDTGTLYRAVARDVAMRVDDEEACVRAAREIDTSSLSDPELRRPEMGEAASIASAIPAVREALVDLQRRFASRPEGAVLDGRDCGTVICPTATLKVFLTADVEVRAARFVGAMRAAGHACDPLAIETDLRRRDDRDRHRRIAPTLPAADAVVIDTTSLDADQVYLAVVTLLADRRGRDPT